MRNFCSLQAVISVVAGSTPVPRALPRRDPALRPAKVAGCRGGPWLGSIAPHSQFLSSALQIKGEDGEPHFSSSFQALTQQPINRRAAFFTCA